MKAEQFFFKKVTLGDLQAQQQKLGCLIFPKTFNTSIVEQWSENDIEILELDIKCMESSYFLRGDDSHIYPCTLRK